MDWTIIALLIFTALVLIAVDFYLPGFVLGSIGAVLMIVALVFCYRRYGLNWTLGLFLLELVMGIGAGWVAIKYGPRTSAGKKMILAATQMGASAQQHPKDWIGREGVAQTVLRPAGVAMIDGKRLDVEAESGMIEGGSPIKIIAVHENRLVVKKIG